MEYAESAAGSGAPARTAPTAAGSVSTAGQVLQAVRLTVPVGMAYVPLGVAFGVLLVTSGIRWVWAPLSAMVIFAGSIEFL
ncbi:MAG TPA: AzlC family ABC transporter permease, partial [Jatrophihabitans sp.]